MKLKKDASLINDEVYVTVTDIDRVIININYNWAEVKFWNEMTRTDFNESLEYLISWQEIVADKAEKIRQAKEERESIGYCETYQGRKRSP